MRWVIFKFVTMKFKNSSRRKNPKHTKSIKTTTKIVECLFERKISRFQIYFKNEYKIHMTKPWSILWIVFIIFFIIGHYDFRLIWIKLHRYGYIFMVFLCSVTLTSVYSIIEDVLFFFSIFCLILWYLWRVLTGTHCNHYSICSRILPFLWKNVWI